MTTSERVVARWFWKGFFPERKRRRRSKLHF
jgi:nucleotide-binding universal stress UspA family protein